MADHFRNELVVYYSGFGGNPNLTPLNETAEQFAAKHPGLNVRVVYENRLQPGLSLQEVNPDIVFMQHGDFDYYHRQGYAADLHPWFKESGIVPEHFFAREIWKLLESGGHLTAVPVSINLFGVAYNKEWLDKAGVNPPDDNWTWEQFVSLSEQLQRHAPDERSRAAKLVLHLDLLENLVASLGGSYLSPDGRRASGYLNGEASVNAVQWAIDFIRTQQLSVPSKEGNEISVREFNEGRVGMTVNRYEDLRQISSCMADKVGFAPLPCSSTSKRSIPPIVYGFGMSSFTRQPRLAFEFLCHLTLIDNAFIREEARRPQLALLRESDAYLEPMEKSLKRALELQFPYLTKGAYLTNPFWFGSIWNGKLHDMVEKQLEVRHVLDSLAVSVDRHFEAKTIEI